jgi:hypothetical protein
LTFTSCRGISLEMKQRRKDQIQKERKDKINKERKKFFQRN